MKFLLLNQTFYPDVPATGQYLAEVASALAERGHEVTVVTSRRAYDQPETKFAKAETWRGIRILRVASTGFGKGAKWRRAADFASFMVCCAAKLATMQRYDAIVALTSPPLISFLAAVLAKWRRSRFVYWVMDLNPDEAVAAGWLRSGSMVTRILEWMSRFSMKKAAKIVVLDRFMRERLLAKGIASEKIVICPPWSLDGEVRFDQKGREVFRRANGLEGKFVVMYSGNHSPCHPLDTLVAAARRMADDKQVTFCFVGGGSEWRKIKTSLGNGQNGTTNVSASQGNNKGPSPRPSPLPKGRGGIMASTSAPHVICLPYQPLDKLAGLLSAADLHIVVMGQAFVGLVHPCKIYNILSIAAPVLCIGPTPSHLTEILSATNGQYRYAIVPPDQVEIVVEKIQAFRAQSNSPRPPLPDHVRAGFARITILPRLITELEGN
jgi:glycosyltransferase involved in cell wall biosynthesis